MKSSLVTALTTTGQRGNIYNGVADWLYEEEILAQSSALWPAEDGSKLAYLVFNDSLVDLVSLENFGLERTSGGQTNYQENKKLRYPKVRSLLTQNYEFSKILRKKKFPDFPEKENIGVKKEEGSINHFNISGGLRQPNSHTEGSSFYQAERPSGGGGAAS